MRRECDTIIITVFHDSDHNQHMVIFEQYHKGKRVSKRKRHPLATSIRRLSDVLHRAYLRHRGSWGIRPFLGGHIGYVAEWVKREG